MIQTTLLEDQIRQCFGRVVYTHKTHEKMADQCAKTLSRMKILQIVLSALTASGIIGMLKFDDLWLKIAAAAMSFINLYISSYMKSFDPGATSQKHRDAARKLWNVRESYLSLLTEIRMKTLSDDAAIKKRDELQKSLASIYASAPHTNDSAYADAQKALKELEEYTFSDDELDKFLQPSLRKNP